MDFDPIINHMQPTSKINPVQVSPIYLDYAKVGASMIEVGIDYQEIESKQVETRWFRDHSSETDVFIWMNRDRRMIKQQISVMGLVAEWNILDGVRTGVIFESEMSSMELMENGLTTGDTASEVIHFDKKAQQRTLSAALSILNNMTCLEYDLKKMMIALFEQGRSFSGIATNTTEVNASESSGIRAVFKSLKDIFLSCFKK